MYIRDRKELFRLFKSFPAKSHLWIRHRKSTVTPPACPHRAEIHPFLSSPSCLLSPRTDSGSCMKEPVVCRTSASSVVKVGRCLINEEERGTSYSSRPGPAGCGVGCCSHLCCRALLQWQTSPLSRLSTSSSCVFLIFQLPHRGPKVYLAEVLGARNREWNQEGGDLTKNLLYSHKHETQVRRTESSE